MTSVGSFYHQKIIKKNRGKTTEHVAQQTDEKKKHRRESKFSVNQLWNSHARVLSQTINKYWFRKRKEILIFWICWYAFGSAMPFHGWIRLPRIFQHITQRSEFRFVLLLSLNFFSFSSCNILFLSHNFCNNLYELSKTISNTNWENSVKLLNGYNWIQPSKRIVPMESKHLSCYHYIYTITFIHSFALPN